MIASLLRVTFAAAAISLLGTGCSSADLADRKPIPSAPVGVPNAGIGAPGGSSADTRGVGTVASGEGDSPLGITSPASANPGAVTPNATHGVR